MVYTLIGNLAQTIGSILLLLSYAPQIKSLIVTKEIEGVSQNFWLILTIGLALISLNMYLSRVQLFILLTQVGNTILALITLLLVMKYKKK